MGSIDDATNPNFPFRFVPRTHERTRAHFVAFYETIMKLQMCETNKDFDVDYKCNVALTTRVRVRAPDKEEAKTRADEIVPPIEEWYVGECSERQIIKVEEADE